MRRNHMLTALACAVAVGVLSTGCTGRHNGAVAHRPQRDRLVASLTMATPGSVTTAFGSVWVANGPAATLTRLDPPTNAVIARIPTPEPASVVDVGAGAIWVTSFPGNSLTRIDPRHNRVTRTISLAP